MRRAPSSGSTTTSLAPPDAEILLMPRTKITVYVTPDIAGTLKRLAAISNRSVSMKVGVKQNMPH